MERVNEGSTAYLGVTFRDKTGVAAAPASVSYRVDSETGEELRDDTALGASSAVEIVLTPDDNAITSRRLHLERHIVTVTATYGASDAVRAQYVYQVRNLAFAP